MQQYFEDELRACAEGKVGRKSAAKMSEIRRLESNIEKIKQHEKSLRSFLGSSTSSSKAGDARRRMTRKTPTLDEGHAGSELPQDAEEFHSKQVQYHFGNDPKYSVRSRRYASGDSAQAMSRRLQAQVLDGHTYDLDIRNCCFSLLHQIVAKLEPQPPLPDDLDKLLEELAHRRDSVISRLSVSQADGKEILNAVMNGGTAPDNLKDHEDIKRLQKLWLYARWVAVNALYDDYMLLKDNKKKPFPSASIFSLMWTAVEDWILDVWAEFAFKSLGQPAHLSLHFDGLRISKAAVPDMDEFIKISEQHILEATGYKVAIACKTLRTTCAGLAKLADRNRRATALPGYLLQDGNCIPCACWHAFPLLRAGISSAFTASSTQDQGNAPEPRYKTYRHCATALGMSLMCCTGLPPQHVKAFLLHCEGDGKPHCVSVQIASIATVSDGNTVHSISLKSFQDAVQSATDSSTIVSYWQAGATDKLSAECAALLDMEAGAGACGSHDHQGDMEMLYVQEVGGDNSDDEDQAQTCKPKIFELSDEGTLFVCDNILEMMAQEVQTVLGDLSGHIVKQDGRKLCPFCPFRSFTTTRRLRHHLTQHHSKKNQFVCSGTKQLKVILALHDFAAANQSSPGEYLQQSAAELRKTVSPALEFSRNRIDKSIRLVFRAAGPAYVNVENIGKTEKLRRVANMYYDHSFADLLLREMILHHGQEPWLSYVIHKNSLLLSSLCENKEQLRLRACGLAATLRHSRTTTDYHRCCRERLKAGCWS